MVDAGDERLVLRDAEGHFRFNAEFANAGDLQAALDALADTCGDEVEAARQPLHELFESVFTHRRFTGRSGSMFKYEGLGCIYWHMVSKLLLATGEVTEAAVDSGAGASLVDRLGACFREILDGLGSAQAAGRVRRVPGRSLFAHARILRCAATGNRPVR